MEGLLVGLPRKERLGDVCKHRDSILAYQLRRLEQGCRLGGKMENGKTEGVCCAREASA